MKNLMDSSSTTVSSSNSEKQSFNRKSAFSSTENISNTILCRQNNQAQTSTNAVSAGPGAGLSISGSGQIQRKSISNLNDHTMFGNTSRTSYSSLHRREKENDRMQTYLKTLNIGGTSVVDNFSSAKVSSTSLSTSHTNSLQKAQQSSSTRNYVRGTPNSSSISFGNEFYGASSYQSQYMKKHEGRCPVAALHENAKLTKVTKQHTYFVTDKK